MKNLLSNLKKDFLDEVKLQDKSLYNVLIISAVLTLSVLISFWLTSFSVVTCVLACVAMFLIKGIKKIYILIYLLPLYNVIKIKPDGFVLCSIVLIVAIAILAFEYLIDLIKKRKRG